MATITGLIAKENVVGTFGVLYADGSSGEDEAEKTEDSPETQEMAPAGRELQASLEEGSGATSRRTPTIRSGVPSTRSAARKQASPPTLITAGSGPTQRSLRKPA